MSTHYHYIIIDDDFYSNFICQMVIKKNLEPIDIHIFEDAGQGMQFIKDEYIENGPSKPTILLLDINMPIMNGWEFLEYFEKLAPDVKDNFQIYLLSSSVDYRDSTRASKINSVKQYLIKPLTKEKVELHFLFNDL